MCLVNWRTEVWICICLTPQPRCFSPQYGTSKILLTWHYFICDSDTEYKLINLLLKLIEDPREFLCALYLFLPYLSVFTIFEIETKNLKTWDIWGYSLISHQSNDIITCHVTSVKLYMCGRIRVKRVNSILVLLWKFLTLLGFPKKFLGIEFLDCTLRIS